VIWRAGEREFMALALDLAARAKGRTSPNPMVGCVIVAEGKVIGQGYHQAAGRPHAEVEALRQAGASARGATAYVTLEPCCHHGRTPPCTQALIAAGVAEVVFACHDVNPKVAGRGKRELREAGIEVRHGLMHREARHLNRAFFHFMAQAQPYLVAKIAMSLDGRIATRSGESQWISSPQARELAHGLRQESDAILVGTRTAIQDNPRLTVRSGAEQPLHPLRVVLDRAGSIPLSHDLLDPSLPGRTLVILSEQAGSRPKELDQIGIDHVVLALDHRQRFVLSDVFALLAERDCLQVMAEGGAELLGDLLDEDLVDEVWAFVCPMLIGGTRARSPFAGLGAERLAEAKRLRFIETIRVGPDVLIKAMRRDH